MARSWWIRGVGLTGIGTLTLARASGEGPDRGTMLLGVLFLVGGLVSLFVAQRRSKRPD